MHGFELSSEIDLREFLRRVPKSAVWREKPFPSEAVLAAREFDAETERLLGVLRDGVPAVVAAPVRPRVVLPRARFTKRQMAIAVAALEKQEALKGQKAGKK